MGGLIGHAWAVDEKEKIAIDPSCAYLATYVVDIMNSCCKLRPPWLLDCDGAGQVFDTDGYNVIVSAQVSGLCVRLSEKWCG